ncbi:MAG: amidohydrolase family protein, partial [Gemmatimonadales bacterium]
VQRDDQESRYTRDNMPGMSFTPDGTALIASWGGKINRIDIPSGTSAVIPFTAEVEQQLGPLVHFDVPLNDSILTVQQIRHARPSPDGKRLAFTALDRLWIMDLPDGEPRRLTDQDIGEYSPAWSPDGRYIAYITWNGEGGDVYRIRADGGSAPERLTRERAFYDRIAWTPSGSRLVLARGPRQPRLTEHGMYGMELVWLPADGGEVTVIAPLSASGQPHFTRDTTRIFITDGDDGLISMRFDGTDIKPVIKVTGFVQPGGGPNAEPTPAGEILISPEGDRAIAEVGHNVYLVAAPQVGGDGLSVSILKPDNAPVPVTRVTQVGGDFLGWHPDGKRFHYSLGHSYFTWDIALADSLVRDSTARADSLRRAGDTTGTARPDSARKDVPAYEPDRLDVLITVPRDRPEGTLLLRGARIITMRGDEVIESGEILIRDNRIAAIGPAGSLTVPDGTRVMDVPGTTIIPGWVDIHAHLRPSFGIHTDQVWEYLANLAYGVTTTRDPQTGTTDVLSYADRVATGALLGPRIFSTGPGVFWSEDIGSLDEARDVLRRYAEFYNTHTIKQYGAGDRKVRQWIIMAARELSLMPTSENYLDFKKNLTEAIDGYPGAEHSYPIIPLYRDVVELLARSGITNTPTLL